MLIYGKCLNLLDSNKMTPLAFAAKNNNYEMVQLLCENGANPFQMIDKKGKNGISIALDKKNKSMISNIVKYAGKMTDMQGNTILHYSYIIKEIEDIDQDEIMVDTGLVSKGIKLTKMKMIKEEKK